MPTAGDTDQNAPSPEVAPGPRPPQSALPLVFCRLAVAALVSSPRCCRSSLSACGVGYALYVRARSWLQRVVRPISLLSRVAESGSLSDGGGGEDGSDNGSGSGSGDDEIEPGLAALALAARGRGSRRVRQGVAVCAAFFIALLTPTLDCHCNWRTKAQHPPRVLVRAGMGS
ncbi:hypothetical protein B0T26DRAFT_752994 [Lasiosphaeria miniovina]|uniref:Uncharacterized protein n=1 Tax=Lasiosphaeria miniovina TaxID=1954250 RepID=A0AA40DV02_9PEZI|nr:uncharacterized protein B0T26DRAFT_752994 [Lasiosphaeria miniovina]KAK0712803.1 hypothetical protein B0T26DRAFT_752994 [Lasiosphaeria miniovina]